MRKQAFLKFLKSEGYEILWFLLGAKQTLGDFTGPKDWPGELQISGAFRVKDGTVVGKIRPKFKGPGGASEPGSENCSTEPITLYANQECGFEPNVSISNWICCNLCVWKRDVSYWWKAISMLP